MRSLPNIIESGEQMLVEHLFTEGEDEALDEGILIEVSISMCSAWRLKSSTTLKVRKRRPQAKASLMKSTDQTASGNTGM